MRVHFTLDPATMTLITNSSGPDGIGRSCISVDSAETSSLSRWFMIKVVTIVSS